MKMTDDNKASLIQYVWRTQPSGSTNLFGALEKALEIGGRGVYDKYYQTAFDTIFVLSDGAPTAGEITDTEEILRRVQEANKFKRVLINTVTFGDVNNMRFMKALAEQSGGEHLHVE
jgi:Mg-chelatase subunit ChlD